MWARLTCGTTPQHRCRVQKSDRVANAARGFRPSRHPNERCSIEVAPALASMSQRARDRSLLTSLLSLPSLQLRNDFQVPLPQLIVKTHKGLVSVPVVDVVATTTQLELLAGIIVLLRWRRIGMARVINRLAGDEIGTEGPDVGVLI